MVVNIIVGRKFKWNIELSSLKNIFRLLEIHNIFDDTFSIQNVRRNGIVYGMSNTNRLGVNENEFIKLFGFLWMVTKVMRVTKVSLD